MQAATSLFTVSALLRVALFPAVLLLALATTVYGLHSGLPPMPLQFGSFLAALTIVALAERLMPHDGGAGVIDWKVDALSFGAVMTVINPVLELGLPLLAAGLLASADLPAATDWFPVHWPLLAKVALAAAIAEFGQYWMHRLAHEWPPLWRFHASHHSSERLYWLNGFRVHPANVVWHHLAGVFVLKLLGADTETLAVCLTMAGVASAFQHANLRLIFGPLNWIFSTNELHRWHHADRPDEANRNYGGTLSIWDLVFGTYLHRPGRHPDRYGLFPGHEDFPRDNWWAQLAVPFRRRTDRS